MAIPQATLGVLQLPLQFSYDPYVPRKRRSVTPTSSTVVIQASNPVIVHGDSTIGWEITGAFPNEFQSLWDLYDTTTDEVYSFVGYWGEAAEVLFVDFKADVKGRIFNLTGTFQVLCFTDYAATCGM